MNPVIGTNVDGWCTRCKLVLAHTIEIVTNGKVVRVHCNTCGGRHAHRRQAPGAAKRGVAAEIDRAKGTATKQVSEHSRLLRGRTEAHSRPYSTSARFAVGEVVSHATFGIGVVMAERDAVKIDVVFASGPRVLLHGR